MPHLNGAGINSNSNALYKMITKLVGILKSVRFWGVTVVALAAVYQGADVGMVFDTWVAAVVAIGTVDKFGASIGGGK